MCKSLLIIEDDDLLRNTLVESLEDEGFKVTSASSGAQALEIIAQQEFDLILSDIRMEHMDGIECLGRIKRLRPESKSILITGYAGADSPARAVLAGANDYLYKPVDLDDLMVSVERVLDTQSQLSGYLRQIVSEVQPEPQLSALLPKDETPYRERANRAFFLAVRTGYLGPAETLVAWTNLHSIVMSSVQQSDGDSPVSSYEDYINELLSSSLSDPLREHAPDTQATSELATHFYEGLRDGSISFSLLELASFLYEFGQARSGPEWLSKLVALVWGSDFGRIPR